jgi:hypothetical protein
MLREEFVDEPDHLATVSSWHTFSPPGAQLDPAVPPAATQWGYERADVFALDTSAAIVHGWTWNDSTATNLGFERFTTPWWNSFAGPPSAVSLGFGQVSVFVVGRYPGTGATMLLTKSYDYSTGWVPGGADGWREIWPPTLPRTNSRVAVASQGLNKIDLFFVDTAGILQHGASTDAGNTWTWDTWTFPNPPPGIRGSPEVTSWGEGSLQLVLTGTDGKLYHAWMNNGVAAGWETFVAPWYLYGAPTIVSLGDYRLHVEAPDWYGNLEQLDYDGGWSSWTIGTSGSHDAYRESHLSTW